MRTQFITRTISTSLIALGLLAAGTAFAQQNETLTTTTDTSPPVISDITTESITENTARVLWETDEEATSMVEYGVNTFYGASTTLNTVTTTNHDEDLSGLMPGTTYHFRVHSKDEAGNLAISGDHTFTTLGTSTSSSTDTSPPIISDINASAASSSAMITWQTNEAADSMVNYGTTTSYGASTTLQSALVNSHSVSLSGLTSSTTYHFQVVSKDDEGNIATSSDRTFMTLGAGSTTPTTTPPVVDNEAVQELIDSLNGLKGFLMGMINFLDEKINQLVDAINNDNGNGDGDGDGDGDGNGHEDEDATITPNNNKVREGTTVDFTGRHFGIEEDVEVKRGGTVIRTAHADNAGGFSTGSISVEGEAGDSETYTFRGLESDIEVSSTIQIIP